MASEPSDSEIGGAGFRGGAGGVGPSADWLVGGGELGELIRSADWSSSPFGPRDRWPESLRTAVNIAVASRSPMCLLWGPELRLLYNDGYIDIAADKHPGALGRPMREVWPEIWPELAPVFAAVMERGESFTFEDRPFRLVRRDVVENTCFTLSYSPVYVEGGAVGGVLTLLQETTAAVESRRLLRESEEKHRALIETTATGFVILDRQGRVLDFNREYARLTGRGELGDLVGHSVLEWTAPHDQARTAAEMSRCFAEGLVRDLEIDYLTPAGELVPLEINATVLATAEGPQMMALCRDITERKRAEQALREQQQTIGAIVESSRDWIWAIDLGRHHTYSNHAVEKILGYPLDEIQGMTLELLHPEDRQVVEAQWPVWVEARRGWENVVLRWRAKDGTYRYLESTAVPILGARGELLGFRGVDRDITDRRRAEEALRTSEAQLRATLDNAPSVAVQWLDEEGRVLYWNTASEQLYGWKSAEALGKTLDALIPLRVLAQIRETGNPVGPCEARVRTREGRSAWVLSTTFGIPLGEGRTGFVRMDVDVTERKRVEGALLEADRRKNEFLAMLSHELRNPLAPIRNGLYILDRAAPGGEQARRAQAIIDRQVGHLTYLVDELLDVTRITRGKIDLKRDRVELNALVQRTVEDHRGAFFAGGIELELRAAPAEVWVDGDSIRLAQAVGNLLQNAAKFTPRGGSATISVEGDVARAQAVLSVRDTGAGIPPEMVPRVFEAFAQADRTLERSKGGLGLGLALVKSLVEMHGGSVSAASDGVGRGAVFTIRLPLETVGSGPAADGRGAHRADSPRRVLVIEDNVDAAESLRDALELGGHIVVVAHDGPGGIERARALRPDVVLCDIGLPGMDGYAVARVLRADPELGRVTIVALTGYAGPEDVAKAKAAGFDAHIAKPPSMEALGKVVAATADGK